MKPQTVAALFIGSLGAMILLGTFASVGWLGPIGKSAIFETVLLIGMIAWFVIYWGGSYLLRKAERQARNPKSDSN